MVLMPVEHGVIHIGLSLIQEVHAVRAFPAARQRPRFLGRCLRVFDDSMSGRVARSTH
jgi:hypothetical protein